MDATCLRTLIWDYYKPLFNPHKVGKEGRESLSNLQFINEETMESREVKKFVLGYTGKIRQVQAANPGF